MSERIEWDDDAAHHIRTRSLRYPDAVDIEPAWTVEAVNDPDRIVDEPDAQSAQATVSRTDEQERVVAEQGRIAAATQARRKAGPAVQAPAPPARSATTTDAPQPGPVANPYPGYTGPRCYAPGGKTWKPC